MSSNVEMNGNDKKNKRTAGGEKDVLQRQGKVKEPKTRFVRRRAVFGKRGTQKRVKLPTLREFASINIVQNDYEMMSVQSAPSSGIGVETTIADEVADISEAYAVFCTLLRSGEWENVETRRGCLKCLDGRNVQTMFQLLYFVCKGGQMDTAKKHDDSSSDLLSSCTHIVVPISVTECRPSMALLTTILKDSRRWKELAEPMKNLEDKDNDITQGELYTHGHPNQSKPVPDDRSVEIEEPLLSLSLGLVDSDGTTSLLRCYDSVEPPEPEANRTQLES